MAESVNVVGLGYIGLPTALMLASKGLDVAGTDINVERIKHLRDGNPVFTEDGLGQLYAKALANGIRFTDTYEDAEVYIVAVPTPFHKSTKKVDADYLIHAVEDITKVCREGSIIVVESTIPPGTIDRFVRPVVSRLYEEEGKTVHLAHAPERIIPGKMISELVYNNRTIGADDAVTAEKIYDIYSSFCKGEIVLTDIKTAEMSKVVENAYRDINIAYANELVKICRAADVNVYELVRIANMHPRVNILSPGPGVGGHCISVDPWFLVGDYPGLANMILAARKINDSMPEYVLGRIGEIMEQHGIESVSRVGLYGLAYKEDVDDVRESPTLQLLECMRLHLARGIKVYDPYIKEDIVKGQYHDFDAFIADIDMIVIMVGHNEIKNRVDDIKGLPVLDTRNVIMDGGAYKL